MSRGNDNEARRRGDVCSQRHSTSEEKKNFGLVIRKRSCWSKAADKCLAQGHIGENPCLSALFFICLACIEISGQFGNIYFFNLGWKIFGNEKFSTARPVSCSVW